MCSAWGNRGDLYSRSTSLQGNPRGRSTPVFVQPVRKPTLPPYGARTSSVQTVSNLSDGICRVADANQQVVDKSSGIDCALTILSA
jgi:hypothetical protein